MTTTYTVRLIIFILISVIPIKSVLAGDGKLIATPGVTQFEGSGGGGLVPGAMLAGYASREEIAAQAFATQVVLDDFSLIAYGMAFNFYDRVELSIARQELDVDPLAITISKMSTVPRFACTATLFIVAGHRSVSACNTNG